MSCCFVCCTKQLGTVCIQQVFLDGEVRLSHRSEIQRADFNKAWNMKGGLDPSQPTDILLLKATGADHKTILKNLTSENREKYQSGPKKYFQDAFDFFPAKKNQF